MNLRHTGLLAVLLAGVALPALAKVEPANPIRLTLHDPVLLWIDALLGAAQEYAGEGCAFPASALARNAGPGLGPDQAASHDSSKPRGPIWKLVWSGFGERWPGAAKANKTLTIPNDDLGALIAAGDLEGQPLEKAVALWMEANGTVRIPWIGP